jgi:hypothetical protein
MESKAVQPRFTGAAAQYIEARLASGHVAFALTDLAAATGLSELAAKRQISRLGDGVVRVCRPHAFFLIVGPEHRPMGAPPVTWWLDDYFQWIKHPYYLALQSAADTYGASPQALQLTQVMTDVPRRDIAIGRIRLRFFVKRSIQPIPVQAPANAYAPIRISTPEATVLDLIRYAGRIGGLGRAMETILPLLPSLRIPELKHALDAENEPATAQRLGYLLELKGHSKLAEVIHGWLPSRSQWVSLIKSKAAPAEIPEVPRWRILNNSDTTNL